MAPAPLPLLCACIDIGSNTTRLLVAEPAGDQLNEVMQQRAFTRVGKGLKRDGSHRAAKIAEVAEVVATQVRLARELGADTIRAVATAAIRQASNRGELCAAIAERSGIKVHVLEGDEEARLAFIGATRALGIAPEGEIAVIDVGGGARRRSPSGPSRVACAGHLRFAWGRECSPTPTCARIRPRSASSTRSASTPTGCSRAWTSDARARRRGGRQRDLAAAAGGRGARARDARARGARAGFVTPIDEIARRFELEPERVRLLPAGILILEAISDQLGVPLQIGRGGLREGVILELIAGRDIAREAA